MRKKLETIGEMRPGVLTKQYRLPAQKKRPFWQISYTHKNKSRTEYVRPEMVPVAKAQIAEYKKFRQLIEQWVDLSITLAGLRRDQAREQSINAPRASR